MKGFRLNSKQAALAEQKGATLIVVLIILVAMTFLGLGGMSDSNLQFAMVRNSQLQYSAHAAALSEINEQLAAINGNAVSEDDQLIKDLINSTPDAVGVKRIDAAVPPATGQFEILLDDVLSGQDYAAYEVKLSLSQLNDTDRALAGFSLDDPKVKALSMQFVSSVTVKNTGAQSTQTQGFIYLAAAGG